MRRGWVKVPGADAHVLGGVGALERGVVAAGVEGDLEARGRDGPGVGGARDDVRLVLDGLVGVGLGQVGEGDLVAHAGGLLVPVGEGGLAGEQGLLGGGRVAASAVSARATARGVRMVVLEGR